MHIARGVPARRSGHTSDLQWFIGLEMEDWRAGGEGLRYFGGPPRLVLTAKAGFDQFTSDSQRGYIMSRRPFFAPASLFQEPARQRTAVAPDLLDLQQDVARHALVIHARTAGGPHRMSVRHKQLRMIERCLLQRHAHVGQRTAEERDQIADLLLGQVQLADLEVDVLDVARCGHGLQATALVHEVYLRLVDVDRMTLTSRAHFFGVAATLMRQILVDHARRQRADKRGGGVTMLTLDEASPAAWTSSVDVLALDQALDALSAIDSRQCRVVELRFFAGLTIDEAATALGTSPATVEREWVLAKAWLFRRLSPAQ
jgi:RNA polymerase sigma factor (TIGR02999 family)